MINKLKEAINEAQNIIFFTGAGMSTASGIPDFRSAKGLFTNNLHAEEIVSHSYFMNHPEQFYDFYFNRMVFKDAKPNPGHIFIASLQKNKNVTVVTQNIDGLHTMAGSKNVIELQGTIHSNHCMKCHKKYTLQEILYKKEKVPHCSCGGIIKPDVVLYEEALNEDNIINAVKAIEEADTLVILGTSLSVYPAAGFIQYFRGRNLILINKSQTPADEYADIVIHDDINETFSRL
ncbi:MAG: NAD-dependent protein deacylase [Solobacterium sp.]|nr:NAD-dependent protein deacylase [Solobacterium sp.]